MSSAKAALESDTRVLAFEAGRKQNIRVNTISAGDSFIFHSNEPNIKILFMIKRVHYCLWFSGPLGSRAAKAIGFIDTMIEYSYNNAPIQKTLTAGFIFLQYKKHFLLAFNFLWKFIYFLNGEMMQMKLGMRQPSWHLH